MSTTTEGWTPKTNSVESKHGQPPRRYFSVHAYLADGTFTPFGGYDTWEEVRAAARRAIDAGAVAVVDYGAWAMDAAGEHLYRKVAEESYKGDAIGSFDLGDRVIHTAYSYYEAHRLMQRPHWATIEEARAEVDRVNATLGEVGQLPATLDRAAYEAACAQYGVKAQSDADLTGPKYAYGYTYWAGRWPEYPIEAHVSYALDRRRRSTVLAEREAAWPPAPPRPQAPEREMIRCRVCGELGHWGESPFTTYGHTVQGDTAICDDCGA